MNEKEFLSLIAQYQPMVDKICRIYRDRAEDREDLFQEIIFQLWKAFPSFRNEAKISTWLYRIALNTAMASFRRKSLPIDLVTDLPDHQLVKPLNEESNWEILLRAIKTLNEADRALITLYLEDFSYQQIAEVMGITENNVGVKLNRIKEKIKKLITN